MIRYRRLLPKTSVFTVAELLAGFGSKLGELTTAPFVIDAGTGGVETRTMKLTAAEAPLGMFLKVQVMVPVCASGGVVQAAPPEFIDRNIDCEGSGFFVGGSSLGEFWGACGGYIANMLQSFCRRRNKTVTRRVAREAAGDKAHPDSIDHREL